MKFDWYTATPEEQRAEAERRNALRDQGHMTLGERSSPERNIDEMKRDVLETIQRPPQWEGDDPEASPHWNAMRRVMAILAAWAPDARAYHTVVVHGEPRSKARPRFAGGHAYSSVKQRAAEKELRRVLARTFTEPLIGNVAVVCGFYRSTHGRVDVDNMLKHVMDAANRTVFRDDSQVTAMSGYVELDKDAPRIVIGVATYECSLSRAPIALRACAKCGKMFQPHFYGSQQACCSQRCAINLRGADLRALVPCKSCGVDFRRRTVANKYCSQRCSKVGHSVFMRKHPIAHCKVCDRPLPRPEAKQCRRCWAQRGRKKD